MADNDRRPAFFRRITIRNPDGTQGPFTPASIFSSNQIAPVISPILGEHVVDCDAAPFCPKYLFRTSKGTEHRKGGQLVLTPGKIRLFLAEGQKNSGWLTGHDLRKELADKPVLNANVLDYLLAHQELIPEEWKGKVAVLFWGTIYRDAIGSLYVRYADWRGDRWVSSCDWLGSVFHGCNPAAVLASPEL
ncbi:hypothetical protein HY633_04010 [Candidatus Uhrbacteria bacterium]|nr:hypothetical protein [Candidatus Uhrbacteria bacterium]